MKKIIFLLVVLFPSLAFATPVLLDNVPAYNQNPYPWCSYVSEASIFAYWDMHGYQNLFAASAPGIFLTPNVWPEITEMWNITQQYIGTPGWDFPEDITRFAQTKGYSFSAFFVADLTNEKYFSSTSQLRVVPDYFEAIVQEIDKGYPMIYNTGSGDPIPVHAEPVFGYDMRSDGNYIAYYTNWYESEMVLWKPFNRDWIADLIMVEPINSAPVNSAAVPEPSTMLLLGSGLLGLIGCRKKFKK